MNYIILVVIVLAIFGSVMVAALAKEFRHAFLVPEGYVGCSITRASSSKSSVRADTSAGVGTSHWQHKTCARARCSWRDRKSSRLTTSDSS